MAAEQRGKCSKPAGVSLLAAMYHKLLLHGGNSYRDGRSCCLSIIIRPVGPLT